MIIFNVKNIYLFPYAYLTYTPSYFSFIKPNTSLLPQGSLASIPSNAFISKFLCALCHIFLSAQCPIFVFLFLILSFVCYRAIKMRFLVSFRVLEMRSYAPLGQGVKKQMLRPLKLVVLTVVLLYALVLYPLSL